MNDMTLKQYEKLGPFEIKDFLAKVATKSAQDQSVSYLNAGRGNPKLVVVGLPDAAVKESRDRVWTAVNNSGYRWPRGRTTVNLAPADVKKEGPSFDLPIALGTRSSMPLRCKLFNSTASFSA